MRPNQLGEFRVPTDIQLHPVQDKAVFVVTRMDLEQDEYVSSLWMWNGSDSFPVTDGVADTSPRWSPDGGTIAFLGKGTDHQARSQVMLRETRAEPVPTAVFELGVSEISWSPDGSTLAVVVPEYVDGHGSDDERNRAPRRIQDPAFRYDNKSWTYNRRSHIWLIDVATGNVTRVSEGDRSNTRPAWSPDGTSLLMVSDANGQRWINNAINTVRKVDLLSGDVVEVAPPGEWTWCGYASDGTALIAGVPGEKPSLRLPQVYAVDREGSLASVTSLDGHLVDPGSAGSGSSPKVISVDTVACLVEDHGAQRVVQASAGATAVLVGGKRSIGGFGMRPDGSEIVFTASTPLEPGEAHRLVDGVESIVTDLNTGFARGAELIEPTEFTFESDGTTIHGWVFLPEGEEDVPLLLSIHGGPASQYSWGFFDEFQMYVGAGFGVVAVNPRGSSGYGYEHVAAPVGRWGDPIPPDHLDLRAAPYEAAKQFPRLDLNRMGISGGSYGGLSTAMVTALDSAYRSAVAERGVYNWVSFAGTSDIPWFVELYFGAAMPDGADTLWRGSALARADAIVTPTLVVHSEHDFRCPLEQGQQLFTMLYTNGVDTELLLFPPDEGHELSRSGKPRHRVERFDAILGWHSKYLSDG